VGVLSHDLRTACLGALHVSRDACRAFALERSWENSARQFIGHVSKAAEKPLGSRAPLAVAATAHG